MELNEFVNSHAHNVKLDVAVDFDDVADEFVRVTNIVHDYVEDRAFPVIVYKNDGKFVGWVDMENYYGYVA